MYRTSLDNFEREYWEKVVNEMKSQCGMGMSVKILLGRKANKLYLGFRQHDLGGTDYSYVHHIPMRVAKYLMDEYLVRDVWNTIRQTIARIEAGLDEPFVEPQEISYQKEMKFG